MKKILRSTLAIAIGLSLAACHSDNNQPAPGPDPVDATTLAFSGAAIKGALQNALVNVYSASDLTTVRATAQTDATGNYTATITDATGAAINGAFVVSISADDDTTMVCDATACEGADENGIVPAAQLTGLELSTFTFSDGAVPVAADINTLTTMATDAIVASAAANTDLDLSTVTLEQVTKLQTDASQVVGAVLGIDLSQTNVYDVKIVDASVSADVATDDAIAATLTLINASFSGLNVTTGETFASTITEYFVAVETVTTAVLTAEDPATVDLGAVVSQETLDVLSGAQAEVSTEVTNLIADIEMDTGVTIVVEEVPATVEPADIAKEIGEVIVGTGGTGTGGTGGTGG